MKTAHTDKTLGFTQEIPGGYVFELGNTWVHRRIHCINERISTTSLVNVANGEEYLDETNVEFELTVSNDNMSCCLDSKDFEFTGYETTDWTDEKRTLELKCRSTIEDKPIEVSVFYSITAGDNYISKWLQVHMTDLPGWFLRYVTIENMRMKEMVEGVAPQPRYIKTYDNHEDNVHSDPDKANTAEPGKRFMFSDFSRAVVTYWGYNEGFFFFTKSLLGEEVYNRPTGLLMRQREYIPLAEGFTSGPAILGAYKGHPEIGFKRYTEFLLDNWCAVRDKDLPSSWNTWMITLEDNKPLLANYDRDLLMSYMDHFKELGVFDVLHLDLGWEAEYPLMVDRKKFPNGMSEVSRAAKEQCNMDMSFWINPFSSLYWKSKMETEHPEWCIPDKFSSKCGAQAICIASDYYDYVTERFKELVTDYNARILYWDGLDWNIPACEAPDHDHKDHEELKVKGWKMLANLCEEAHAMRPDLLFIVFSLPFDNHRLRYLDQEQISDTYHFPTVQVELIQRQQLYQMTWEHPYKSIWGSWYGLSWKDAGKNNLTDRDVKQLMHAEMSMIGNGIAQAGASFDLKQGKPDFMAFLKKLFAFRKRFTQYFDTYQHVLGFPDGRHIDGEGHIVGDKGFIVLVNPTDDTLSVTLPLSEPELELDASSEYSITDWTNLEKGEPVGKATLAAAPEITLGPLEVKYIGINID